MQFSLTKLDASNRWLDFDHRRLFLALTGALGRRCKGRHAARYRTNRGTGRSFMTGGPQVWVRGMTVRARTRRHQDMAGGTARHRHHTYFVFDGFYFTSEYGGCNSLYGSCHTGTRHAYRPWVSQRAFIQRRGRRCRHDNASSGNMT